jgi:hypothetical protein
MYFFQRKKESINGFNKHDIQQETIQKRRNRPIRTKEEKEPARNKQMRNNADKIFFYSSHVGF